MVIHRKKISENIYVFVFTKSKNRCIYVRYDKRFDFGEHSTSGASIEELTIHYKNAMVVESFEEIKLMDVPKSIRDTLTFLA